MESPTAGVFVFPDTAIIVENAAAKIFEKIVTSPALLLGMDERILVSLETRKQGFVTRQEI